MYKILIIGIKIVLVFIVVTLIDTTSAVAETQDRFSCSDGRTIEFTSVELPSAPSKISSSTVSFEVKDSELVKGSRPRIDATLAITISNDISPDDIGIVSAHVNGKTFLQMRVFPDSMDADEVLWTIPTLFDVMNGKFDSQNIVVDVSNYLQDGSLGEGINEMGIGIRNVRGEIVKSAQLLSPTQLVIDARSPQLLVLGVAADEGKWSVDKETTVEVVVNVQKECQINNVTVDIVHIGGSTFTKRPVEPLEAIQYQGEPIAVRFGLIPEELGILEAMVVARADGQDAAQSILIRSVGEPKTNRIDANNFLGYIVFGALSAVGVWLLLGKRKVDRSS